MPFGKWQSFDDCVKDFTSQGKDEESAQRICGYLQAQLGKESFSWVGDIEAHEKNLIRGKALHPIKTVHPEEWPSVRVYLEEELQKATHTLAGKPLLLDHLYPIDGAVAGAEYEDGAIEYVAELNDEKILDWIRDGVIKHCSVEYDWSSLEKFNGVAPRGIRFTGLALLKNFEPGDPETSVEVWESIIRKLKESKAKEQRQNEPSAVNVEDLRNKIAILADHQEVLEKRVTALEKEKADLTKKLGEAVIEPQKQQEDFKQTVLRELKASVFERVPRHWGYGPYEQNRRVKSLIRKLEVKDTR